LENVTWYCRWSGHCWK